MLATWLVTVPTDRRVATGATMGPLSAQLPVRLAVAMLSTESTRYVNPLPLIIQETD